MTQTTAKQTGIVGTLRDSPATKSLVDQAKNLAKARGAHLVGKTTERLTSSTDKLNVLADTGGAGSALKAGAQQLASGKSPLRAAFTTAASAVKDKVESVLHLGGKGSGGKSGPPKATNIEETIDVGAPVTVAYDQWTQYPQFSRFMKGVEAVDAKSETEQNWRSRSSSRGVAGRPRSRSRYRTGGSCGHRRARRAPPGEPSHSTRSPTT